MPWLPPLSRVRRCLGRPVRRCGCSWPYMARSQQVHDSAVYAGSIGRRGRSRAMASNSRPASAHRVNGQCGPGRKTGNGLAHNASRQPTPVRAAGSRTPRQASSAAIAAIGTTRLMAGVNGANETPATSRERTNRHQAKTRSMQSSKNNVMPQSSAGMWYQPSGVVYCGACARWQGSPAMPGWLRQAISRPNACLEGKPKYCPKTVSATHACPHYLQRDGSHCGDCTERGEGDPALQQQCCRVIGDVQAARIAAIEHIQEQPADQRKADHH